MEGFDYSSTLQDWKDLGDWTGGGAGVISDPFGGNALDGDAWQNHMFGRQPEEFTLGFRLKTEASFSSSTFFMCKQYGQNHIGFAFNGDGTIRLHTGGAYRKTSTIALQINTWHYIELYGYIDDSSGSALARIDGVECGLYYVGDTRHGGYKYTDALYFDNATGNGGIDDIYVLETSGPDFLGDIRVEALDPEEDGYHKDWTPSSGSDGYAMVDDAAVDDDSTYNTSGSAGDRETYGFGTMETTLGTVYGVQQTALVRKTDAGSRSVSMITRSGSTDYTSGSGAVTDAYARVVGHDSEDHNTAALWTIAGVNAAEFGINIDV
jgi:hypothetical protein